VKYVLHNEAKACQRTFFLSEGTMALKKTASPSPVVSPDVPIPGDLENGETALIQRRIRQQHAQERAQDYVEAIADLILSRGEARATDLAKSLGITHVTVVRTVQRLQRDGLVTTQPYRSIFLTEAGRNLAANAKHRHETVIAFLEALGISSSTARLDAEGIEHHVSEETLEAFKKFLLFKR
jgi:DtxR family manganese transport transcriptional regulator